MLLAFSGPASNVRVEHVSRDHFNEGGAFAEVMSLYENMDGDDLTDHPKINTDVKEQSTIRLGIEV